MILNHMKPVVSSMQSLAFPSLAQLRPKPFRAWFLYRSVFLSSWAHSPQTCGHWKLYSNTQVSNIWGLSARYQVLCKTLGNHEQGSRGASQATPSLIKDVPLEISRREQFIAPVSHMECYPEVIYSTVRAVFSSPFCRMQKLKLKELQELFPQNIHLEHERASSEGNPSDFRLLGSRLISPASTILPN